MSASAYTPLDFSEANQKALALSDHIRDHRDAIIDLLTEYESHEVAVDELNRTHDILDNLLENKDYFTLRVGAITTFLPRNQPLYALTCFVFVPSLMAAEVHFRVPHGMKDFLPRLIELINLHHFADNLFISSKERLEFLKERSALLTDPHTGVSRPLTDAVIFTGTSLHADQLRTVFSKNTLFITNGAGHNPIVVTDRASIDNAVEAVVTLTTYNQGQDCAAPNSILVHHKVFATFLAKLEEVVVRLTVGSYKDPHSKIGPISDPADLTRVVSILVENKPWISQKTPGNFDMVTATLEPTIIIKPLTTGGNYTESFAPLIFVQEYQDDTALSLYFENEQYFNNAMYITVYGSSVYIESLIGKEYQGKILHHKDTLLQNTHLHAPGIERGTQPYGGYGYGASSISINGVITPKPTLPQRDIYEHVALPILSQNDVAAYQASLNRYTDIEYKKVEKLLKIKNHHTNEISSFKGFEHTYVDLDAIRATERYVALKEDDIFELAPEQNAAHIETMTTHELNLIGTLRTMYEERQHYTKEDFVTALYAIAKQPHATRDENAALQLQFFKHVYQLLFNKAFGPRLGTFLWTVDDSHIMHLLDV